uniref:Uncharacterized protein n=1 Tax=Timema monikensis TaxID=170555 RepID=A0A7R9E7Q2_9NEOP|nr:unnamed protein product [Timema monikensis]
MVNDRSGSFTPSFDETGVANNQTTKMARGEDGFEINSPPKSRFENYSYNRPPLGYGGYYRYIAPDKERPIGVDDAAASGYRGGGGVLSAWGIVGILLFIIAVGTLIYYTVICYPVCKNRRHIDRMKLEDA